VFNRGRTLDLELTVGISLISLETWLSADVDARKQLKAANRPIGSGLDGQMEELSRNCMLQGMKASVMSF
jgi:hypothetical protein